MDRKLAARLARYSEVAYRSHESVIDALPDAKICFVDRDDTQAYVIETDADTAVAFRGTQVISGFSAADILSNLWIKRMPWHPGKVHGGYREALLDIVHDIKSPLYDARRPVFFTGHSMGGALATLASTLAPGPTAAYTFGAPRVGNATFAKSLRNLFRIVHANDIAPRYPLPLGYRHGGEVWHLSAVGRLYRGLPFAWYAWVPLKVQMLTQAVLDHRIGEYVRKLG